MDKSENVERCLFEIARTLEFCRNDPAFPESIPFKVDATAHVKAKSKGGKLVDLHLIEWKGGAKKVVGGDWYELPVLLQRFLELSVGGGDGMTLITVEFSPQDVLSLRLKNAGNVLEEWSYAYSAVDGAKSREESAEDIARADDVSGVPKAIVGSLRELNTWLRDRLYPLKSRAAIPVKFWQISEPDVLWSALQYLYGHLLKPYDYDESALLVLPSGYTTACTIFNAFEQIDNEGFETGIENLGPEYCEALVAELRRVGLATLGDSFRCAWDAHPEGPSPDPAAFECVTAKIEADIEDQATMDTIHRHVSSHAASFEREDAQ